MTLNQVIPEVLDIIIGHLEVAQDPNRASLKLPIQSDLLNARLVCRAWHKFATPRVFYTITLLPTRMGFEKWRKIMGNETLRSMARRAEIYSTPPDLAKDRDWNVWELWENEGKYPEFTDAITQILHLPHLEEVCLNFSDDCWGVESTSSWDWNIEKIPTRLHTMTAVFEAIRQRARMSHLSKVRSLVLDNLQNLPTPDFTSSALFKAVTRDLDELHLWVTHETDERVPELNIRWDERITFEPFMHQHWLSPLGCQLTTLTLYFQECWGVMPGIFDGRGLVFPRLQTLSLGYYTIAHHDQFDWVLRQTSLKSLYLDRCFIASYIRIDPDSIEKWGTPTADWDRLPQNAFGLYGDFDAIYHFPGTWRNVFNKIRTQLSKLTDFRFHIHSAWPIGFLEPAVLRTELSPLRYITFDDGLCPSEWIEANAYDGEMDFGDMDPSVDYDPTSYEKEYPLNRSKETWDEDSEALKDLVEATWARRRRL